MLVVMKTIVLSLVAAAALSAGDPTFYISPISKGDVCEMSGGYICPKGDAVAILVTWDEIASSDGVLVRGEWVDIHGAVHVFAKECGKAPEFPTTGLVWIFEPGVSPEAIRSLTVSTYKKVRDVRLK